jgi:hypothetical protein
MAKQIAPTKNTSGKGFDIEDEVVAYFLVGILGGQPLLGENIGVIRRADFQQRANGWLLDDLLLTIEAPKGTCRCAASIKSSPQFSATHNAPKDFVETVWQQRLHEGTVQFDPQNDWFMLATGGLAHETKRKFDSVCEKTRKQDIEGMAKRLQAPGFASDVERQIFSSFSCPVSLANKHGLNEDAAALILRQLLVIDFDFEAIPSQRRLTAIENCRQLIRSGDAGAALNLWNELTRLASAYRHESGYLDLPRLLGHLRTTHDLLAYPSYQIDWQKLERRSDEAMAAIPDTIGGKVHLERKAVADAVQKHCQSTTPSLLLGRSGSGKSAIAKGWASNCGRHLFIDAGIFAKMGLADIESRWGIQHQLTDVFKATPEPEGRLVLDGIEQLYAHLAFANLASFIKAFSFENTPWRVLITTQAEESERVTMGLATAGVVLADSPIQIALPDVNDLQVVWDEFPALRKLLERPQLRSVVLRPKVLDLLATRANGERAADASTWVGESNLIEWFWLDAVDAPPTGAVRSRFAKKLAILQADGLRNYIPEDEIIGESFEALDQLTAARICRRVDEQVGFDHALFADWARQRVLVGHAQDISTFLRDRTSSPMWHQAIRLYGLYLLEQKRDPVTWLATARSFFTEGLEVAGDCILESAVFAAEAEQFLEQLWPDLTANNGEFLRRLLNRFYRATTFASPVAQRVAEQIDSSLRISAAAHYRIPYGTYWPPVLRVLDRHRAALPDTAVAPAAVIAFAWLNSMPTGAPLRLEAARLSISLARRVLHDAKDGSRSFHSDVAPTVYQAVLHSAADLPDEVTDFVLRASGRQSHETAEMSAAVPEILIPKSHDGASFRVDDEFRTAALQPYALLPLMKTNAAAARETLAALLIKEPAPPTSVDIAAFVDRSDDDLGLEDVYEWFPAFYTRGPFLLFLGIEPREGIELIIRLTNYATEGWQEQVQRFDPQRHKDPVVPLPAGEIVWRGDADAFHWHDGDSRATAIIASALMALEKWLVDQMDAGKDVSPALDQIVRTSRSVALAGVLCALAKKHPQLLADSLSWMLWVPEFHHWDLMYGYDIGHAHLAVGFGMGLKKADDPEFATVKKWYEQEYRRRKLQVIAQHIFLNMPALRPMFGSPRKWLQDRAASGVLSPDVQAWFQDLADRFDINNWQLADLPDGRQGWTFRHSPEQMEQFVREQREANDALRAITVPGRCRDILNRKTTLSDEELKTLWEDFEILRGFLSNAQAGTTDRSPVDGLFGVAAVLLMLHAAWLDTHPRRKRVLLRVVMLVLRQPPPPEMEYSEYTISDHRWTDFLAEILPMFWFRRPLSRKWRKFAAEIAMGFTYSQVRLLFSGAFRKRKELNGEFERLQNFLLHWAVLRQELNYLRHGWPALKLRTKDQLFGEARRLGETFVSGEMCTVSPSWESIAGPDPRPIMHEGDKGGKQQHRRWGGLDIDLIVVAHAGILLPNQAANPDERIRFIAFWEEALAYTIGCLGDASDPRPLDNAEAYKGEKYLLEKIAYVVAEMTPDERPERLWQAILDLARRAERFVDDYLCHWFTAGLSGEVPSNFLDTWESMLKYAQKSQDWKSHGYKLWRHLLGIDNIVLHLWNEKHGSVIDRASPYFLSWLEARTTSGSFTEALYFLRLPVAARLRLRSLVVLAGDSPGSKNHRIYEDEATLLCKFLEIFWSTQQAELRQSAQAFAAYKLLLHILVGRQIPLALELQERLRDSA